jgi:molybdate transport system substrate-binding protein
MQIMTKTHIALVRTFFLSALAIVSTVIAPASSRAQSGDPVVVYAAASLKNVLDDAMARWRSRSGQPVVASYSHAPALAKQIEQGAPADIFISADTDWMDYVDKLNLIDRKTRVDLVGNGLVLIAASDDPVRLQLAPGADLAGATGDGRIAVCTIASCPGGKYAKAALEGLGIWDAVKPKLIDQETIRVALAAVARGEARFAIVYSTDAAIEPKVRVVDRFPPGSHPPVVFPAAIVAGSKHPGAAAFFEFLRSPEGSAVFEKYGFVVPKRQAP